jgi:hypothetical protein
MIRQMQQDAADTLIAEPSIAFETRAHDAALSGKRMLSLWPSFSERPRSVGQTHTARQGG